ncbi:hypothetical protein PR048_030806 [Dryococelus australis]|uniref:Uncharacterized protein n=1 Tax=Dryococelus australis TaxID=614101 RepID=A0ABQ9GDT0_9NEOP|nr:hypothetical protein PR048_030806 [Dryococelus australis]
MFLYGTADHKSLWTCCTVACLSAVTTRSSRQRLMSPIHRTSRQLSLKAVVLPDSKNSLYTLGTVCSRIEKEQAIMTLDTEGILEGTMDRPLALQFSAAIVACVTRVCPVGYEGRGGVVARLLTSYRGEPGTISKEIAPGFSNVGIVQDDAAGRRVFSGVSRFPHPCNLALFHAHLASPSSTLKTLMLSAAQISSLHAVYQTQQEWSGKIWVALNVEVLKIDYCEVR